MLQTVANQFNSGGPFMWVILGVFALACAVALERFIYYFIFCQVNRHKLLHKLSSALTENRINEAITVASSRKNPLYRLLKTAIDTFSTGADIDLIQEKVETTAIREVPKVSKRLNYLSLFANIATLLGLLGTISGLQVSFSSLASVDAAQKASLLANGISQAMSTTAFGLIVAVPCMILYTLLNNKKQELVKDIDESVVTVLSVMKRTAA